MACETRERWQISIVLQKAYEDDTSETACETYQRTKTWRGVRVENS